MSALYTKPKNIRYTDMSIWLDTVWLGEGLYKDDREIEQAFKYMYLLAYMLASKAKYFDNHDDYDGFAYYLTCSTYSRIKDPEKVPLKSALNYMKSIMYFRKAAYLRENFSEVIDPEYNGEWDGEAFVEKEIDHYSDGNRRIIELSLTETFENLPMILREAIPDRLKETKLAKNIYISALLSFLHRVTLPKDKQEKLEARRQVFTHVNEDVYYFRNLDRDKIVLWGLNPDYEDTVRLVINKVNEFIRNEIQTEAEEFLITSETYKNMSANINIDYEGYE